MMDDTNSVDSMYEFLVAECGAPPPRYDDVTKKKGCRPKCGCRTKPSAADAKGCGRAGRPDKTAARPPSPWAAADACSDAEPKRRAAAANRPDRAANCGNQPPPPPPPPQGLCEMRCVCRYCCVADGRPGGGGARKSGNGGKCARDDYGDGRSPALLCRWSRAAFDWLCDHATHFAVAAVAFFAGMYLNDYCNCVYDDDS